MGRAAVQVSRTWLGKGAVVGASDNSCKTEEVNGFCEWSGVTKHVSYAHIMENGEPLEMIFFSRVNFKLLNCFMSEEDFATQ